MVCGTSDTDGKTSGPHQSSEGVFGGTILTFLSSGLVSGQLAVKPWLSACLNTQVPHGQKDETHAIVVWIQCGQVIQRWFVNKPHEIAAGFTALLCFTSKHSEESMRQRE